MIRFPFLSALLLAAALSLLAGCSDGRKLQQDVQAALAQHAEIKNYTFSGEAKFALRRPEAEQSLHPATAKLVTMLSRGRLSWQGTASTDPARAELMLRVFPEGETQAYEMPMLLQDSKLYVHLPAVNAPGQYYMIDLAPPDAASGDPALPAELGAAGELLSLVFSDLIAAFEPKRFQEEKGPEGERTIAVTLSPRHMKEALDAWYAAAPAIAGRLELAGYVSSDRAGEWQRKFGEEERRRALKNLNRYRFDEPFRLSVNIDEAGFLRETRLRLALSVAEADGTSATWAVDVLNRYDHINENAPFVMPIPEQARPFNDILDLLGGAPAE